MIKLNGKEYTYENYPDGTQYLKVSLMANPVIEWHYQSESECMTVYYIKKKMDELGLTNVTLFMPYIPNARMDKQVNPFEVATLKYFCKFLNSMKFDKVYVLDAHSQVSLDMIHNVEELDVMQYIRFAFDKIYYENGEKPVVFLPDAGAKKKYGPRLEEAGYEYTYGIKSRDYKARTVAKVQIAEPELVNGRAVLIVDDICSKGSTFVRASEALEDAGAEEVNLYVTHCEQTIWKGNIMDSKIRYIFTTDSIYVKDKEYKDPIIVQEVKL